MPGPEARDPDQAPMDSSADATASSTADAAALRDAEQITARVAADEAAADAERGRLAREKLPVIESAEDAPALEPDEQLHAVRHAAMIERTDDESPEGGTLYLTSARLIHVGSQQTQEIPLERIADMAVAVERLLLIGLTDGSDLAIEVDQPRLLRVQVAAARGAVREREQ